MVPTGALRAASGHTEQQRKTRAQRPPESVPPSWVAASVGFYDQSHFGKQFRRILGVTPGACISR